MLKGHVFAKQLFGNPIFALFINTFLNGKNGVSKDYKNGMAVTYSGNTVTVYSGAICIQGRFLEEDTTTTISAGTDTAFCKLVIEINLDKQNTETDFLQGGYKIIKSASAYPTLTQTDIVKNNAGVYQYEIARFKTSASGITEFSDRRTFLDFDSIYTEIQNTVNSAIQSIEDGTAFVQKEEGKGLSTNDFTDAYKTKLDGIASGATKNTSTATTSANGLMSSSDKSKLDGIAIGANKTTVENVLTSNSTTNALSAAQGKTLKTLVDAKQKTISKGTATPSGGNNGDIYIQYFN